MAVVDGTSGQPASSRGRELRWATASLVVSIVLLITKFVAYFLTHSNAIFSDALENIVNVVTAGFAIYSIHVAHRPADQEHPYGHGKVEFFSAGLEGSMIVLASVLIVGKVGLSFLYGGGRPIGRLDAGLALMGAALLVNGAMGMSLWYRGRKGQSLTLEAEGIHLMVDAWDSVAVLAAIAIVRATGWQWVDPLAAVAVAVYIAILGLGLLKRSAAGLMDEQDAGDAALLRKILDAHAGLNGKEPRICSYHKLRHRHSGRYHWVDFHIMVPPWWSIEQGHQVASAIEYEIELALHEGNATAHVEPCEDPQCKRCEAERAGRELNRRDADFGALSRAGDAETPKKLP
ncbi:MAG TPA: cation diffusion facilitator family transporter [Tepidisphaeraceae bacterium]|jgi:cation diffusion facilitator family transporter|nr:cation diffusion facilitator family transporter [Tepidisphaeraceae bacterium]